MADCLFCAIAGGERPAGLAAESKGVLAIRDINPVAPTHVLLIPKRHVESAARLGEGDQELLGEIFGLARQIAADEGLDGWRLVTNVGASGGQAVGHLHFHLLGGRQMGWPPG
ncbi:MAG: histidine triad nucleotide-binding protein [Acidimicrobiia bacterium]